VTGFTASADFPTTAGAFDTSFNGTDDVFVTKLDPAGSALVYSTYLGGSAFDLGFGIAVDASGSAYVTGFTFSADFPTTAGAFDTSFNGTDDVFVTKLDPAGSALVYSTYLGGSAFDQGSGIAVDTSGSAYVTGFTDSADFPTTAGAFDTSVNGQVDTFVTKLSTTGVGVPATLALSPAAHANPVGTTHAVTATVTDASRQPVANVTVRFSVTGSITASGSCPTDTAGQCSFPYRGPTFPGADLISAYADTNDNGVQDTGEPAGTATQAWVLPSSSRGHATGGGHITDVAGNNIAFGFTVKSDRRLKGRCTVVDHAAGRMIKCLDVLALVQSGNMATFWGNATDNGMATSYMIQVFDNGEPGRGVDTFAILTASSYSRFGTLTAGNVQVH